MNQRNEVRSMKRDPALTTWRWPIALGLVTAIGLVAGLVSDQAGDVIAWVGLGLPLLVIVRHVFIRRRVERR